MSIEGPVTMPRANIFHTSKTQALTRLQDQLRTSTVTMAKHGHSNTGLESSLDGQMGIQSNSIVTMP